ncbi:hypothetical protein Pelo_19439 [Pelomyxa schiedti]|nr:hypothetical protein Pelo_19439 [Pelomyxa schiedti]
MMEVKFFKLSGRIIFGRLMFGITELPKLKNFKRSFSKLPFHMRTELNVRSTYSKELCTVEFSTQGFRAATGHPSTGSIQL